MTDVNLTITDNLASFQAAESVTVYSFGKQVGTLRVTSSSRAWSPGTAPASGPRCTGAHR